MVVGSIIVGLSTPDEIRSYSGLSSTENGDFSSPGTGLAGITLDSSNNLVSSDANAGYIYSHSGISPTLTGSFATANIFVTSIAMDGENLLSLEDNPVTGSDFIIQHDGVSSTLTGSFAIIQKVNREIRVWNGDLYRQIRVADNDIHIIRYDGVSATELGSIQITDASDAGGHSFTFNPNDDNLFVSADANITATEDFVIREYDGFSNTLIGSAVYGGDNNIWVSIFIKPEGPSNQTYTKNLTDSITIGEEVTPVYSRLASRTFTETPSDSLTIAEDVTTTLNPAPKVFTETPSDSLTIGETVTISRSPRTVTKSITESLVLNESIVIDGPPAVSLKTKVEINGIEQKDIKNLTVKKSIDNYNAVSNYIISMDSPFGRHKNDFNVGDEVIIYAGDVSILRAENKILTGIIEELIFKGKENTQTLRITGRDYTLRLLDSTVEPIVYSEEEISNIVKDIVADNVLDITTNNVDTTGVTLNRIRFNHVSVFEALKQLAELAGFIFYVDIDKDLHFEERESTDSGITIDNTNIIRSTFDETREGMTNSVWVYGDRYLAGFEEVNTLIGSTWGGAVGSVFTLLSKPHSTYITYLGIPQKGGVFELTQEVTSGINYLVNYDDRQLIFTSGTSIGNSIPISGGSIVSQYDREVPIVKTGDDRASIARYGLKRKIINDKTIKDPRTASDILKKELEKANPFRGIKAELNGWLDLTPGNTVHVTIDDFGLDEDVGLLNVTYFFDKNTIQSENIITITLDRKIKDITDEIKDIRNRINLLEAQDRESSDVITRLENANGSLVIIGSHWEVTTRYIGSDYLWGVSQLDKPFVWGITGSGLWVGSYAYPNYTLIKSGGYY